MDRRTPRERLEARAATILAKVGQRAHEPVAPVEERRYPEGEPRTTWDQAIENAQHYLGAVPIDDAQ